MKITLNDVTQMRAGAEWWISAEARSSYSDDAPESFDKLRSDCLRVADAVETALAAGDTDAAEHAAHQWPDQAGPWR